MLNQENYKNSENIEIIMHFIFMFLKVLQTVKIKTKEKIKYNNDEDEGIKAKHRTEHLCFPKCLSAVCAPALVLVQLQGRCVFKSQHVASHAAL